MAELESRFRAARAYAGLTQEEMATILGFSLAKLQRIEAGSRGVADYELPGIIRRYGEATGLPPSFFSADWSVLEGAAPAEEEAVASLNQRLERLAKQLQDHSRESSREIEKVARAAATDRGRLRKIEDGLERLLKLLVEQNKPRGRSK